VPRIDGAGRTTEVPEDPFNERRLLDAGDDAQPAAAVPAGFIGHVPVPDRFAAAFGRANRQSCRFADVNGEHAYMDAPTLPSLQFVRVGRIRLHPYIRTFAAA
jgi:hypothetical protein